MKKLSGIVCLSGVLGLVSVAYGLTRLEFNFCPPGDEPGLICGKNVDGMAILNYVAARDETIMQVIFSGNFQADSMTLTLLDCLDATGNPVAFPFFLDENGAATLHETLPGNCSGTDLELRDKFHELLAIAFNNG